ncbi:YbaB/EbfC family nucleoid-associated protein [Actinoplanes philippinensis]|uniref:YbaB/EbfC family nucleoid-associated protein n=1 Tax=Actinoplanes philippinensis TaxID=35752 RepID=UPI00340B3310
MFDGRSLGDDQRLIDEWRDVIEKRAAQSRELETRLAQLSGTARSPDGLVTVTVGPAGDLAALDLGEGIRRRAAAVTAREIVSTLRAAHVALVAAATAGADETVGAGTATGRAIISAYVEGLGPSAGPSGARGPSGGGDASRPRGTASASALQEPIVPKQSGDSTSD